VDRKSFLKHLAILPFIGSAMQLQDLKKWSDELPKSDLMPLLFIGHGSPTNAIEDNEFTKEWKAIAAKIPKPTAILCISAHWETKGTFITAMEKPKTIHDFGGFPKEMYAINYQVPGSKSVADTVINTITSTKVVADYDWGLDHGSWVPIMKMYPNADIPVLQLSMDYTQSAQYHYDLAQQLAVLRTKGVLVIGSGNMVHNLRMVQLGASRDFNAEHGFAWAYEMNDIFKKKIASRDHQSLINYQSLGSAAKLAIPTTDHYYPLLYTLAMQGKKDEATIFNDKAIGGSLTMTSVLYG
jgi:4,5-DOPA dioxygenase extradiol